MANHEIREGSANIPTSSTDQVFYNPVQQFNRDLSVLVINTFLKLFPSTYPSGNTLLEALSATGLRSIRYFNEIPSISTLFVNDLCPEAVKNISANFAFNHITSSPIDSYYNSSNESSAPSRDVFVSESDACQLMYRHSNPKLNFHVIDIDPYGSASPFLDSALSSIADGGLLCITCTDMAVLCGGHVETCFSKYSSVPIRKSPFPHEMALRILLNYVDSVANKHKKTIKPLLSLSIDFYIRVFVQVRKSPSAVKHSLCKRSMWFVCNGCKSYFEQPLGKSIKLNDANDNYKFTGANGPTIDRECHICGGKFQIGGPFWNGPLHCKDFLNELLNPITKFKSSSCSNNTNSTVLGDSKVNPSECTENFNLFKFLGTIDRIHGMLSVAREELDIPFYFPLSLIANTLHSSVPPITDFNSALLNAGFSVSGSHCEPAVIKTNASMAAIWHIARSWIDSNCTDYRKEKLSLTSPAYRIMMRPKETGQDAEAQSKKSLSTEVKDDLFGVDFSLHQLANPESRKHKLVRYQENPTKFWGPKARPKREKVQD